MIVEQPERTEEPRPYRWSQEEHRRLAELGLLQGPVHLRDGTLCVRPATGEAHPVRWSRDDYYRMIDAGLLEGKHVELIEGAVIEMSPMKGPHAASVTLTGDRLRTLFGAGHFARVQSALALGGPTDPEPDVAVIRGNPRDFADAHPATALLVVEVAEASLRYDRTHKASLYARAGLRDYWIVDLVNRRLEVYRNPTPDAAQLYGFGYASVQVLGPDEWIAPLERPGEPVQVAELLP